MEIGFPKFCVALGRRVRAMRLERKMTQEDMMDQGFAIRHYQRIEAGHSITLQTLWKLAQAFGVSPRAILPPGFVPGGGRSKGRAARR